MSCWMSSEKTHSARGVQFVSPLHLNTTFPSHHLCYHQGFKTKGTRNTRKWLQLSFKSHCSSSSSQSLLQMKITRGRGHARDDIGVQGNTLINMLLTQAVAST